MNAIKAVVVCCTFMPVVATTLAVGGAVPETKLSAKLAKVGEPAPALELTKLLQAPAGARVDWESLRGNVVVLEFWSAGCVPCLRWLPHLNKIEEKFRDKPIVFLSITGDDEKTVKKFLKKNTMRGWIALDRDNSTQKEYGVTSLPSTVVVDAKGALAGWTHPSTLVDKSELLLDVLAGRQHPCLRKNPDETTPTVGPEPEFGLPLQGPAQEDEYPPLFQILIRRSKGGKSPYGDLIDSYCQYYHAITLRTALAVGFDVASAYIVGDNPLLDDEKYDILVRRQIGSLKGAQKLLQDALQSTFGLEIKREHRLTDVFLLSFPEGQKLKWEPGLPQMVTDKETGDIAPTHEILERQKKGEEFFISMGDTEKLARSLCFAMGKPVLDEANIDGYYLFFFPFSRTSPDPERTIKSLLNKYGLTLTPAKREIEVLVVE